MTKAAVIADLHREQEQWVEWREEDWPFLPLDTVRVIARGVPEFVARLLAAGGAYYFDAPDFVPDAVITPRQLGRPRNRTERARDVGDD